MKKIISFFLILACLFSLIGCQEQPNETTVTCDSTTTESVESSTATSGIPDPEITTTEPKIVLPAHEAVQPVLVNRNEDGVTMELMFHSYRFEDYEDTSLIYGKSNEYLTVDVTVTNNGEHPIYQWLPTYCREGSIPHHHELQFSFADQKGNTLCSGDGGYACPEAIDVWTLNPGESEAFTLQLAAGVHAYDAEDIHLMFMQTGGAGGGVRLYEKSVFENGTDLFSGNLSFSYSLNGQYPNDRTISVNADIMMLYQEAEPLRFQPDGEMIEISQTVSDPEAGLTLEVIMHPYLSSVKRSYFKNTEYAKIEVILTNHSDHGIFQNSSYCPIHINGLWYHFIDERGYHTLEEGTVTPCLEEKETIKIAPGESKRWKLNLFAGEFFRPGYGDIRLFDDVYTQYTKTGIYSTMYACEFTGDIAFYYHLEGETDDTRSISAKNIKLLFVDVREEGNSPDILPETTTTETTHPETTTIGLPTTEKPVIYLYPEEEMQVSVKLDYQGELLCTYPAYQNGWEVLAKPDGTLKNLADGKEYSYLFWDGMDDAVYDLSEGYCVKGEDTAAFLQAVLSEMGLTPKEYNEFIVYWLPKMQKNPYNLITFQGKTYTALAPLTITPAPDSMLRVFMVYQPLTEAIEIEAPKIIPFERRGFTVIEWGGRELR